MVTHAQAKRRLIGHLRIDRERILEHKKRLRDNDKKGGYRTAIIMLEKTMHRRRAALQHLHLDKEKRYNWTKLCKRYGLSP